MSRELKQLAFRAARTDPIDDVDDPHEPFECRQDAALRRLA